MSETRSKRKLLARTAQIGGHVVRERLTRAKAVRRDDIPHGPDSLTPEWLTEVLCPAETGARVVSFQIDSASKGSTSRGRLRLTYDGAGEAAGLPSTVWYKTSPDLLTRLITGLTDAALNEGRFYIEVRPCLAVRAPRGYHAAADPESCRSIVMIEDLARTRDAQFAGPAERYVTREMAESMVDELATYHGAMWNSPRFQDDLSWIPTSLEFQERANAVIDFEKRTVIGVDRCADVSPPSFTAHKRDVWPTFMRSLELNVMGPPTLLHQDVHAGNWYVDADGRMGLYDWHCVARGGWALDFAYALMSGLTVEDRRAWERELLELYLDKLRSAGGDPPRMEEAWLQYRQQTFHGLVFWLYTIGAGRLQPDMQPEHISKANLERMTHAVMDLDSFAAVSGAV